MPPIHDVCPVRHYALECKMQIGIDSFIANPPDSATGRVITSAQRIANLLAEIELADKVGLDVFGLGEHHRDDFLDSAPAVILAAAAARTQRIRLTSAVTVPERGRPGAGVSGVRDAGPDFRRAGGDDRGAGFIRRSVSAVRAGTGGLRIAFHRETGSAAAAP